MKSGIGFLAFRLCRWASVLLVILLSLLVVSCDLWNKDMLGYLEHWSETVQMGRVEVTGATIQKNDSGVDTISLSATPTITGYIINPKDYNLNKTVGNDSSSTDSVRISSGVDGLASVTGDNTMMVVRLASAFGKIEEHTDFTVTFAPVRTDTGVESSSRMSVTLRYNTPPRAPLALMWDSSKSAFVQLQSQAWQPTTGTGTDKDGYIYWGWPEDSYVGSNSFDETAADCVAQFSINGTLHDASNLLVKDSSGSVESFISGSAPYDVYGLQVGSGISVSLFAQDSEGIAGTSLRSGVAPYTITLLGNDGQYNGADTHQLYLQGGSTITKDDLAIFQKEGYKISGWRDSNGAISFPYTVKNDVTLTAQWTANEYTVTLDGGSGSGGAGSTTVTYGKTLPNVTPPTMNGYTFGGYWTQLNGQGKQYYDKDGNGVNTWQEAQDTTLYAQWTANTYTVTFDVNTGAGSTSNVTATYDQQPPAITPPSPIAGGFIFAGYNTQPDGMGIDYYDAHGAGVGTWQELQNTILYAQWDYEKPQENAGSYQVSNPGNLLWIGEQINSGNLKAFNLKLTADIVIPSGTWKPIWVPDGNPCTFDGQGHSITLNETYSGDGDGLFGSFNYSTIENLVLKGSITMNTGGDVGAVSGSSYATIIRNVMSLINITNNGTGSTGGLVGVFGGGVNSTIIENSAVYANVSGKGATGGLVGHLWSGNQPCTVRNSVYMGDVSGSPEGVIVGRNGNNYSRSSTLSNIYYCETSGIGTIGDNGKGGTKVTNVDPKTEDQIASADAANLLGNQWEYKSGEKYPTLRKNP